MAAMINDEEDEDEEDEGSDEADSSEEDESDADSGDDDAAVEEEAGDPEEAANPNVSGNDKSHLSHFKRSSIPLCVASHVTVNDKAHKHDRLAGDQIKHAAD